MISIICASCNNVRGKVGVTDLHRPLRQRLLFRAALFVFVVNDEDQDPDLGERAGQRQTPECISCLGHRALT